VDAFQQLAAAPPSAEALAALQRGLCGLAAAADLLRRHGLEHLMNGGQAQQRQTQAQQAQGPPAWLAPWLGVAVAAGVSAARARGEAAPEVAGLAAACLPLLELPVRTGAASGPSAMMAAKIASRAAKASNRPVTF